MQKTVPLEDRPKLIQVKGCARCGGDHNGLTAKKFTRPIQQEYPDEKGERVVVPLGNFWTHFAECPDTHEPILIQVLDADTAKGE